jgi:cytochrome c biogenesis factor
MEQSILASKAQRLLLGVWLIITVLIISMVVVGTADDVFYDNNRVSKARDIGDWCNSFTLPLLGLMFGTLGASEIQNRARAEQRMVSKSYFLICVSVLLLYGLLVTWCLGSQIQKIGAINDAKVRMTVLETIEGLQQLSFPLTALQTLVNLLLGFLFTRSSS